MYERIRNEVLSTYSLLLPKSAWQKLVKLEVKPLHLFATLEVEALFLHGHIAALPKIMVIWVSTVRFSAGSAVASFACSSCKVSTGVLLGAVHVAQASVLPEHHFQSLGVLREL